MAAKMILKGAKAPLHLLRSSVLSSVCPKTAPSYGEFAQALRIATQKPISEATVLRRHLFGECSLNSQGLTADGPIWPVGNSVIEARNRGSKKSLDVDDDDDFDNYKYCEDSDIDDDIDCRIGTGDYDDDDDFSFEDESDEDDATLARKGKREGERK